MDRQIFPVSVFLCLSQSSEFSLRVHTPPSSVTCSARLYISDDETHAKQPEKQMQKYYEYAIDQRTLNAATPVTGEASLRLRVVNCRVLGASATVQSDLLQPVPRDVKRERCFTVHCCVWSLPRLVVSRRTCSDRYWVSDRERERRGYGDRLR